MGNKEGMKWEDSEWRQQLKADNLAMDILRHRRGFFIREVKAPLMGALFNVTGIIPRWTRRFKFVKYIYLLWDVWIMVRSIMRYPEPTKENTRKWNTHTLIDVVEEFTKYNRLRTSLFKAAFRLVVGEYEHDSDYAQRFDWFLGRLTQTYIDGRWKKLEPWNPSWWWEEPSVVEANDKLARELMTEIGLEEKDIKVGG